LIIVGISRYEASMFVCCDCANLLFVKTINVFYWVVVCKMMIPPRS